jgi:sugar (pentulose or hexulose) kinase
MAELTGLAVEAARLVVPEDDATTHLYITGGFSRNPVFTSFLASHFPDKQVFTSRVDNASSLGAAMVIHQEIWGTAQGSFDLKRKAVEKLKD